MKSTIIGDEEAVIGFGMVGVKGRVVGSPEEAETAFQEALDDSEVGIVLITERIGDLIRPLVDRYIFTHAFPLILEVPDRRGKLEGKPNLREMVNQAIGMRV